MRWRNFQRSAQQLEAKLQSIAEEHNRLFVLLRDTEKAMELKRGEQKPSSSIWIRRRRNTPRW